MSKQWIQLLLLLLLVVPVIGITHEQTEEYAQKRALLNDRAASFKIETGFDGDIGYNYEKMALSTMNGRFEGISVAAPQDTVIMRQVFDQILQRITPYIKAKNWQLLRTEVKKGINSVRISFTQIVNGYQIDGGRALSIQYNTDTNKFYITDMTEDVPCDIIPIIVSKNEANEILTKAYSESEFYDGQFAKHNHEPYLEYASFSVDGVENPFRLYWRKKFWNIAFYVDVETSAVHFRKVSVAR